MYQLEVKFVGKMPELLIVEIDGYKLPSVFSTYSDAEFAAAIVRKYNQHTAFKYVSIIHV